MELNVPNNQGQRVSLGLDCSHAYQADGTCLFRTEGSENLKHPLIMPQQPVWVS